MRTSCYVFLYSRYVRHRDLHSFPTRRSSDLSASSALPVVAASRTETSFPWRRTATRRQTASTSSSLWERSEEHTSELQSRRDLVCRLLLEKKNHHKKFTVRRTITHTMHVSLA